jgi:hyperosmotically inducible protein
MKTLLISGVGQRWNGAARLGRRVCAGTLLAVACLFGQAPGLASETDENLEASARGAFVFRKLLAEEGVAVEVSQGIVTLRGNVALALQRELAEDAVAALPGVKSIDNQIVVKPAAPGSADALLALQLKTILGLHRSGRGHAALLEVKDGAVLLKGEVANEEQRLLAAEFAADVEGVREVRNGLTLAPVRGSETGAAQAGATKTENGRGAVASFGGEAAGEVDDASVAAQVRLALRAHRSTRSLKPGVQVQEGVVTLTGHVDSAAERDRVSRLCGDIHGVRKVDNKMTPEPESTEN